MRAKRRSVKASRVVKSLHTEKESERSKYGPIVNPDSPGVLTVVNLLGYRVKYCRVKVMKEHSFQKMLEIVVESEVYPSLVGMNMDHIHVMGCNVRGDVTVHSIPHTDTVSHYRKPLWHSKPTVFNLDVYENAEMHGIDFCKFDHSLLLSYVFLVALNDSLDSAFEQFPKLSV